MKFTFRHFERGNALFLVLIGVALFAALSYTIVRHARGGNDISTEKRLINGGQIVDFNGELQRTLLRLRFSGCSASQISFENDVVGGYANPSAPSDESCHVFKPAGGGLAFLRPPVELGNVNYAFTVDTGPDEISLMLPVSSEAVCRQIDQGLGLSDIPTAENFAISDPFLWNACVAWPLADPAPAAEYLFLSYIFVDGL